jgi:hypothetical protein
MSVCMSVPLPQWSRALYLHTLRTLIFARHLFSRVHIFAAYIFASEALGINFRYVSIFAWWLFSFFSPENPLEVIFAPVYMLINIVRNLTCWHAYIHTKWASLFSRVVFFAGGNFRIFSRRENYNSAKINVLKVLGISNYWTIEYLKRINFSTVLILVLCSGTKIGTVFKINPV